MKTKNLPTGVFDSLRKKAEKMLGQQGSQFHLPAEEEMDIMHLAHELEVQFVELELQNEELRQTAKELEASRDAFADLYQSAPVGFVTLNRNGVIQQINTAAALMLCDPEEFLSGKLFLLLIHPDDREIFHTHLTKTTLGTSDAPIDVRLLGSLNRTVHAQVHIAWKSDTPNGDFYWRLALVDVTARKQYEDALENARRQLEARVRERTAELELRARQLARLTSELTLAEQRERRRLAEMLHDHLQQMLAGARLNLDILGTRLGLQQQQEFKDVYTMIADAIGTSRSLASALSPPVLYLQGLSSALKWLARWMRQTHKLQVTVAADPSADPAREDLKVLLFQSVRELLFNVVKHSGADSARVEMTRHGDRTRIVVSDPGSGFDIHAFWQKKPALEGGFGLFSIRERLALLGGVFDLASGPANGTTATLSLPLQPLSADTPEALEDEPAVSRRPADPNTAEDAIRPVGDKIRILLVDDHAMMRKGLSMLLAGQGDIEVAGEAEDGRQAVELARRIRPDVILMDINMPVMNGLEATHRISAELPGTRIIALSMHEAADQAAAMKEAGAVAYLNKSGSPGVLLEAIRSGRHAEV